MLTVDDILAARAGKAYGSDGEKIGSVGEVYLDDTTGLPAWATVNTGFFGTSESFVPLAGARVEGEDLYLPFSKAMVKDAPRHDSEHHLDAEVEAALYAHYGMATESVSDGESVPDSVPEPEVPGERQALELHGEDTDETPDIHVIREPLNEKADGVSLSDVETEGTPA